MGQFYLGGKNTKQTNTATLPGRSCESQNKPTRRELSILSLVMLSATAILSSIYENKINKTLSEGCQLHAQKVKSSLGYIGRHQFLFTFTVCHTSEEKIVISMSSTSFGLAQPTQCKCLHLFPPHARPPAHTGGSPPVLFCTAALFLSTDLTHAPEPSSRTPSMSCTFLGQKCPFSSKECPSLSLKEMRVLSIFCPLGALLSVCLLQQVEYQTIPPVTARLCFQLHLLHPLLLTSLFHPSVVFAHLIKTSSSQTPSMFFCLGTSLSLVTISFLQVR